MNSVLSLVILTALHLETNKEALNSLSSVTFVECQTHCLSLAVGLFHAHFTAFAVHAEGYCLCCTAQDM